MSEHSKSDSPTRNLRRALGRFATGITVVTARGPDGTLAGLTVNSFNSVSRSPPLVLWSLGRTSPSHGVFEVATHFAVNVLSDAQRALSERFAKSGAHKFDGLDWTPGQDGAPLLPGCCAWFECAVSARHAGGDHTIFIGEVQNFAHDVTRAPLIYFGGAYRGLNPTSEEAS